MFVVTLVSIVGNCRQSGCCEEGLVCYEQDSGYAQCRPAGACPACSSSWTCNIVHRVTVFRAVERFLSFEADKTITQEENNEEIEESGGDSDTWKKIVGDVSAGVSGLVLIAVLVLYATRKRQHQHFDVPMALKAELVRTISDPVSICSALPPNTNVAPQSEIVHAIDPFSSVKQRRRSSALTFGGHSHHQRGDSVLARRPSSSSSAGGQSHDHTIDCQTP